MKQSPFSPDVSVTNSVLALLLEVWLSQIEIRGETPLRYFPVSFNADGSAFGGRVQNGTMSMVVDE